MKKEDFNLKNNNLLPCPLCGGKLEIRINDHTASRFCNGSPCWIGGATCSSCGIGIEAGIFSWGFSVDEIEESIIKNINRRPRK